MLVKSIMTPRPELIHRRANVVAAARKLLIMDIGVLPVVDRGRLVGMLTDRDLAVRCVGRGLDPKTTTVEQVMSPQVVSCREDDDLKILGALMEANNLQRIVVTNARGKPVGIVSVSDLAARGNDHELVVETLAPRAHSKRLAVARLSGPHAP